MCTGVDLTSKQNHYYFGRTQEFDVFFDYAYATFPRNYTLTSKETWSTKHGVMGVTIIDPSKMDHLAENNMNGVVDGINEHGLVGAMFYFANYNVYSTYEEIKEAGKTALYPEETLFYLLSHAKDTKEVEEVLKTIAILKENPLGGTPSPFHFIFKDKTGRCIVAEPSEKLGFKVFENQIGVFANDPTFDWHLTNLRNYTGMIDHITEDAQLYNGVVAKSMGKGSGLKAMPGDYTSPSRFIRTAYLKSFAEPVDDDQAVNLIYHILSMSDIAKGYVRTDNGLHHTQYTSVYDIENSAIHIKLYGNLNIQSITLDPADLTKEKPTFYKIESKQPLTVAPKIG